MLTLLGGGVLFGQSNAPVQTTPSKPLSFEVVSIKPSRPGSNWSVRWATTPDGYHVQGQSLANTILMAYYPQGLSVWRDRLVGAPAWLSTELYDIDAKVPESEIADWQNQGMPLDQKPLLRQMLQSMLADRCHLRFHRVPAQLDGWRLELAKKPVHLTESKPGEQLPPGMKLADGGVLVASAQNPISSYYSATLADFARQLSIYSHGHPVEDHTGLTGHYDFAVNWITDADHPERIGVVSPENSDPLSYFDLNALGLRLVPMKVPIDNLVIDHIDRPSEN
jgi:uncharacterized protein (TIGR03435 family)